MLLQITRAVLIVIYSAYLVYVGRMALYTTRLIGNKDNYLIMQVFLILLDFAARIACLLVYLLSRPSHCTSAAMELLTGFFLSTTLYLNLAVFINFIGASHYLSEGGPITKYTSFRKRLTSLLFFITGFSLILLVFLTIYTCSTP